MNIFKFSDNYNDFIDSELFDNIDYQEALEQHLNELEQTIENDDVKDYKQINVKLKNNDDIYGEPENTIYGEPEPPVIVKQNTKTNIDIIETNKLNGSNEAQKQIEFISKKHNDFKKKIFVYKPGELEMKFINNLPSESYITAKYITGKNKINKPLSESIQDMDIKILIEPNKQISYATTEYYFSDNVNTNEREIWYPNILNKNNVDIVSETNNKLNCHHSFLTYQNFKSVLISKYPNLIDEINYFIQQPTDKTPSKNSDWFSKFIDAFITFYKYQLTRSHVNDNKVLEINETTLNKSKIKRNFNVLVLPKDVVEIIRHINYYFKDIKDKLTFDEKTGFYMLLAELENGNKSNLPIMCKHVYMTLSGKSLYQISKECCLNGQCKYCGDSMISFADDDSTNIPPSIAELAYRLIECSDSSDDDATFLIMYNMFTAVIYSFVQPDDPAYENKATAIVSLYVYKILNELIEKNIIDRTIPPVKKLISIIADNCTLVGWDEEKMEKLMRNEKIFGNIDVFVKILSGKTEKIIDLDDTLKSIFNSESIQEIKQIKETGKLEEFNTLNEISILDDVNFDFIQGIIDNIKTDYKTKNKPDDIYGTSVDTLELFEKIAPKYCPVNYLHVFDGSECKYCGIKKDCSNAKKIYEKYEKIFNQKFDLDPINKLHKFKPFKQDIDPIETGLKEIKDDDIEQYIKSKLNLNNIEYNKVQSNMYLIINDMVSVISDLTFTPSDKIWKLNTNEIIRIYLYLDKINIAPNLINIFRTSLLPPPSYIKTKQKNMLFEDED
jgi:hypothetical protein